MIFRLDVDFEHRGILSAARSAAGKTQAWLAEELGATDQTIRRSEKGGCSKTIARSAKDALKMSSEDERILIDLLMSGVSVRIKAIEVEIIDPAAKGEHQ